MHKNDLSPLKAAYLSDDPVPIMVFSQYQKLTRAWYKMIIDTRLLYYLTPVSLLYVLLG